MTQTDPWYEGGKEVQSNWFKFEKVGDRIKGTLTKRYYQEGRDNFPDQEIAVLRLEDGQMWNVGIPVNKKGTIQRMKSCKIGEIIGFVFDSEGEPPQKGFNPSKNIKLISFGMDENFDEFSEGEEVTPSNSDLPPM